MAASDTDTPAADVAVVQFAPGADPAVNAAGAGRLIAEAAGADVIVFPEYTSVFIDPFDATLAARAETLDGPFCTMLQAQAARCGAVIVAGMIERADATRVHNTIVAVAADGVRAVYRKEHLYDAFGQCESDWIAPGEPGQTETFTAGGVRFGVRTCYDLRFPESFRVLADARVDAVLVPAQWVRGPLKEDHWRTLIRARAIENTVWLAAADHPAPTGVGASMIVDPEGVVRAEAGAGEQITSARIARADVERVRERNPALALRRYRVMPR